MDVGLISDLHIEFDKAKDLYLPEGTLMKVNPSLMRGFPSIYNLRIGISNV